MLELMHVRYTTTLLPSLREQPVFLRSFTENFFSCGFQNDYKSAATETSAKNRRFFTTRGQLAFSINTSIGFHQIEYVCTGVYHVLVWSG